MPATILDGKAAAAAIRGELTDRVAVPALAAEQAAALHVLSA